MSVFELSPSTVETTDWPQVCRQLTTDYRPPVTPGSSHDPDRAPPKYPRSTHKVPTKKPTQRPTIPPPMSTDVLLYKVQPPKSLSASLLSHLICCNWTPGGQQNGAGIKTLLNCFDVNLRNSSLVQLSCCWPFFLRWGCTSSSSSPPTKMQTVSHIKQHVYQSLQFNNAVRRAESPLACHHVCTLKTFFFISKNHFHYLNLIVLNFGDILSLFCYYINLVIIQSRMKLSHDNVSDLGLIHS